MARENAGSDPPSEEISALRVEAARLREEVGALRAAVRAKATAVASNARPTTRMALLREANEKLVIATLQAQTATEVAERANQDKEKFLAILAHELRNPLAPIVNALAILRRNTSEDPTAHLAI